ncbi:MAG: hypothetical protein IJ898_04510 [Prevotella sp.]|nr:hypothetical protein [Prevotella sp.]
MGTHEYRQQEADGCIQRRGAWQESLEKRQMKTCMVRNKSLSLPRRRKGGRRFYADATTKSLLGHRAPSDFAEEKTDSGFVRYFSARQVFQEEKAESDKVFSTMRTMLTSNLV